MTRTAKKVNALIFDQFQLGYYTVGEKVGQSFSVGKKWMKADHLEGRII